MSDKAMKPVLQLGAAYLVIGGTYVATAWLCAEDFGPLTLGRAATLLFGWPLVPWSISL